MRFSCVVTLLALTAANAVQAGDVYRGTAFGDVVVATVKKVSPGPHTNAEPAQLVLEVGEVLRGAPKLDRSRATMTPPFHGIDYGEPEKNPAYLKWQKQKLPPLAVGDKYILWGQLHSGDADPTAKKENRFYINAYHQYPFTPEKRRWAIERIATDKAELEADAKERETQRRVEQRAAEQWRKEFTDKRVETLTKDAQRIVVGKITSGPANVNEGQLYDIQVRRWLRGDELPEKGRPEYVQVVVSAQAGAIMAKRDSEWLLFLPLKPQRTEPLHVYNVIDGRSAAVPAGDDLIKQVEDALP